jgi:hypothetical protein
MVKFGDNDCKNDYLLIPGGSDNGANNEFSRDRFCGAALGPCAAPAATPTAVTCNAELLPVTSKIRVLSYSDNQVCLDAFKFAYPTIFSLQQTIHRNLHQRRQRTELPRDGKQGVQAQLQSEAVPRRIGINICSRPEYIL